MEGLHIPTKVAYHVEVERSSNGATGSGLSVTFGRKSR